MRAPEFWSTSGTLSTLLTPLGAAFDLAGRWRRARVRPVHLPIPVICVGNLVAGGAGKTPVALALISALTARGLAPHALSRGYGGTEAGPIRVDPSRHTAGDVGDEALLLAAIAPSWVARDRAAGALAITAAGGGASAGAIVMDDGFQNPSLAKDLSLLVVDGDYGFGNERLIPAGPLRERVADGLARADAVVVLQPDRLGIAARLSARLPVLSAQLSPTTDGARLTGKRVLAFAGIGRPEKFFTTLDSLGAELVGRRAFADHHRYRPPEIEEILARAKSLDALPVTTEKDAMRLPPALRARVHVLAVTVDWLESGAMGALLDRFLNRPSDANAAGASR
ncbi:MAG: tetraacyldisaccharide 4'-kinase [Alphaproteobacteria bacterium]